MISLKIDENLVQKTFISRSLAIAFQEEAKTVLTKLQQVDMIDKFDETTDWAGQIVVVKK